MIAKLALLLFAMSALLPAANAQPKRIAVTMIVEVPQLLDVKRGLLEELGRLGLREGQNLLVDYSHAAGSFPTQQQIAKKIIGDKPDLIVPITTPSAIVMAQAAKDSNIPIVFSTVTDPLRAKVVATLKAPGGLITGVSDLAPIELHLKLMKEMVPGARRLGVLMNPSLANTQTYLETLKQLAPGAGLTIVESAAPQTINVQAASTEASAKLLAAANLPSRTDFEALGARLGAIEAALARIEQRLRAVAPDRTPPRPPVARTRKPPAPSGDA